MPLALAIYVRTSTPCQSDVVCMPLALAVYGLPWPSTNGPAGPAGEPLAVAVCGRTSRPGTGAVRPNHLDGTAGPDGVPLALYVCGRSSRPVARAVGPGRLRTDQQARPVCRWP